MHWITSKQKQSLTTHLITLVNIIPFTHVIFIPCKSWILCWSRPPHFELHVFKHAHHVSHSRYMSAKLFSTKWDLNPSIFKYSTHEHPPSFFKCKGHITRKCICKKKCWLGYTPFYCSNQNSFMLSTLGHNILA